MLDFLRFASKNIRRKRFRSFLTTLSIAIGVASVLLISMIGQIGRQAITQEIDSYGVGGLTVSVSSSLTGVPLGEEQRKLIEELPEVESASPILLSYSPATAKGNTEKTAVWGIGAGAGQTIGMELVYGRLFTGADVREAKSLCLVDSFFAKQFFGKENVVGRQVEFSIGGNSHTASIAGVVRSGGSITQNLFGEYIPLFAYLPYTTLQELLGNDGYSAIAVDVTEDGNEEKAGSRILRALEQDSGVEEGYTFENMAMQKSRFDGLLSIVTLVLTCCAGVSLLVSGLGIMTVMLTSVGERTREIGIKKAIGASSRDILFEFLWEALLLSLMGSLAGSAVSLIICMLGCFFLKVSAIIEVKLILFCVAFSLLTGGLFGAYPAVKAAKLPPVEALRSQ